MKIAIHCAWCGKEILKYPSQIKKKNFCCRACQAAFSRKDMNPTGYAYRDFSKNSERFSEMNRERNPDKMTPEMRSKIRDARLKSSTSTGYPKLYGRHLHRVVAELMLGRPLNPGEVVHHIDGNRRNNDPTNLMVFPSQVEHARWHALHDAKGGDSE